MRAKCFFIRAGLLPLALACSNGSKDSAASGGGAGSGANTSSAGSPAGGTNASGGTGGDDDALIVPPAVAVLALPGGNGVLDLNALTLRQGATNTEAYAALKNDGDTPACDAGLELQFFDKNQQPIAASVGGLLTQHLFRFTDGSGTVAACVAPGDVTMAAITDLPAGLALDDVGFVEYSCMYFAVDATPIDGFTVSQVRSVTGSNGVSFTGTFTNGFGAAVDNPSVTVFPVNHVGRPLAAATATGTDPVPDGGSWDFTTSAVDSAGSDNVAFATATVSN
ncbi:MAG TPA: hypothetical protein VMI54_10065 [Polyangiaceae bacterium]|nr:hypothetical protein [Polyangiaceae bacterium]